GPDAPRVPGRAGDRLRAALRPGDGRGAARAVRPRPRRRAAHAAQGDVAVAGVRPDPHRVRAGAGAGADPPARRAGTGRVSSRAGAAGWGSMKLRLQVAQLAAGLLVGEVDARAGRVVAGRARDGGDAVNRIPRPGDFRQGEDVITRAGPAEGSAALG